MMIRTWRIVWWVLAVCWLLFTTLYVLRHDYYGLSDNFWEYYGAWAVMHSWWWQDLKLIARPGYLLNIPLIQLGFSFYQIKLLVFVVEYLSFLSFLWAFNKSCFKRELLPIFLIAFSVVYSMQFQVVFDYYSAVIVFLFFGLAAYQGHLNRGRSFTLAALSCVLLTLSALSNLALLPVFLIVFLSLFFVRRAWPEFSMLIGFLLLSAFMLWIYLDFGHGWQIYHQNAVAKHSAGQVQVALAVSFILLIVFMAAAGVSLVFDRVFAGKPRVLLLSLWAIACYALFVSYFWTVEQRYSFLSHYFSVPLVLAAIISLFFLAKSRVAKPLFRRYLMMAVVVAFVMTANKAITHSYQVIYLYLPVLLAIIYFLLDRLIPVRYKQMVWILLLLSFIAFPLYRMLTGFMYPYWGIDHNRYESKTGVLVDQHTHQVEKRLLALYQQYHCANKPFFAFYDFTQAYLVVGRKAYQNVSYVPTGNFEISSRFIQSKPLIQHFSHVSHWCVAYKSASWMEMSAGHLSVFHHWLAEHSAKVIPVGNLPYQSSFVWFFVK